MIAGAIYVTQHRSKMEQIKNFDPIIRPDLKAYLGPRDATGLALAFAWTAIENILVVSVRLNWLTRLTSAPPKSSSENLLDSNKR